jgi:hypothetical protein
VTTLTLTSVAIAPASDLSDVLLVGQYAQTADLSTPVTVRRYAGGRDRLVTTPGSTTTTSVSFRYLDRATYGRLLDLVGSMVLFRDQRQRRIWGVIGDLSATEFIARDLLEDVSFTITSATVSEIV